jgi:protein arginine kinase activator
MKCEICGKNEATVHLTEVVNDKVTKLHICERCAKTKSEEMQSHFGLHDLLSGLVDFEPGVSGEPLAGSTEFECANCGMTYYDFQRTGRLGCGECYTTFDRNLSELLRKIHGSDRHVGKIPFKGQKTLDKQKDIQRLRSELNDLILAENFEKAALVRDRIKGMEKELTGGAEENEAG